MINNDLPFLLSNRFVLTLLVLLSEFGRTHSGMLLEFNVEVVYIFIAYHFSNLIYLVLCGEENVLGSFHSDTVEVGVEVYAQLLVEDLAKIRAVISEERGDIFKSNVGLIIVIDIIYNITDDAVS